MPQGYDGLPPFYLQSSNPITANLGLSLKGMDPIVAEDFYLVDQAFGTIGIKINGAVIPNANINDAVPAAPPGNVNVVWQVNGSNVSGYVPVGLNSVSWSSLTNALADLNLANGAFNTTIGGTGFFKVGGIMNAVTGYQVNGVATLGHVLRGDGTNFVDAQLGYSDLGGTPTLPQTKAAIASNWLNSYDAVTGLFTATQPAFTDISGSVASTQMPALTGDVTSTAGTVATTLAKLQGIPLLYAPAPIAGQVLEYDGVNWTPTTLPGTPTILYMDSVASTNGGVAYTLTQVGVVGAVTTYTGTFSNGAANALLGRVFVVTGFLTAGNNVTFTCTGSTATTLTCVTSTQSNETHPATTTLQRNLWATSASGVQATIATSVTAAMSPYIFAEFCTAVGVPNVTAIPGGAWQFDTYIQTATAAGAQSFYVNVLKRSNTNVETQLFTTSSTPQVFNGNGTGIQLISFETIQPAFAVAATDVLVLQVVVTVAATRTITLYLDGANYSHVHTPFVTSVTSVASVFGRTGVVTAQAGDYPWNFAGNATADLTLANGAFNTTIGGTGFFQLGGVLRIGGADAGISRLGAASLAVGNGTAGNIGGTLTANTIIAQDTAGDGVQLSPGSGGITGYLAWFSGVTRTAYLGYNAANVMNFSLGSAYLNITTTGQTIGGQTNMGLYMSGAGVLCGTIGVTGAASISIGGANSGLLSWFSAAGTRLGYMGYDAGNNVTLNLTNGGDFGVAAGGVSMASGYALKWNSDAGISRLGAASLAIGNGTASDFSGSLKLTTVQVAASGGAPSSATTAGTAGQIIMFGGVLYFCSVTGAAGAATWNRLNMTVVP